MDNFRIEDASSASSAGGGGSSAGGGASASASASAIPVPSRPSRSASCAATLDVASKVVAASTPTGGAGGGLTSSSHSHLHGGHHVGNAADPEHERLSRDLITFLSDPALRARLASGSLDLSSYSTTVQSELADLERECIDLYRSNGGRLADLRGEMDACDAVLASLQEMLLGFQADLAGLSGDIRTLQEQSRTLGVQLRNRRDAELKLRAFLERIVVPPNLADVICTGAVDETFVECVREVEEKFGYVHIGPQDALKLVDEDAAEDDEAAGEAKDEEEEKLESTARLLERTSMSIPPSETAAGREMTAHLLKLRLRAVARTREYFLSKFAELRRPRTNVRMIQVNALLRYADLNDFLLGSAPDVYAEVRDVYIESMGKTLHALFRTYAAQLSRLDSRVASRNDLVAVDDAALRDTFSTKVNMSKRTDAFHLGDRVSVLDPSDPRGRQPILAHVALAEGERYPYERIFKSVMTHLMDASTNEYVFVRQFFKENGAEAFGLIFSRTLGLVLEQLENYLFDCHDALAILLMIKLTHANRRTMRSRKVDALDAFFDRVANLLWPRLKMVVDAQIRSVRTANAKKLGGADLHPHVVGRRYAEFMSSCLLILNRGKRGMAGKGGAPNAGTEDDAADNTPLGTSAHSSGGYSASSAGKPPAVPAALAPSSRRGSAGDMLLSDLSLLTDETISLLERLADEQTTNKSRTVFLINNADQILCIFQERRVSGGREVQKFADLLRRQRELFVEEELLQGFSKMIAFVQQTEAHLARSGSRGGNAGGGGGGAADSVNPAVVEGLVREFASSWKSNIEQINRNVLSYFSNFRNGMEILKQVLTQLLLYYTRFQDIIRRVWRSKPPAFCKDLVSTTVILAEIKKYALAI